MIVMGCKSEGKTLIYVEPWALRHEQGRVYLKSLRSAEANSTRARIPVPPSRRASMMSPIGGMAVKGLNGCETVRAMTEDILH